MRLDERPPQTALRWAVDAAVSGGRLVRTTSLRSEWTATHRLDIEGADGVMRSVVLRRWARPGWELVDPDFSADREAVVLELLAPTEVPAPRLIAVDPEAAACDVPALVMEHLPGSAPSAKLLGERIEELAEILTLIHSVPHRGRVSPFRSYTSLQLPQWLAPTPMWERAVEAAGGWKSPRMATFIHRDYHPENTLWAGPRLTGVVDWTKGSVGDPSADLAHMRMNLVRAGHAALARRFTMRYTDVTGIGHDPTWDIVAVLDSIGDTTVARPKPAELERLTGFVGGALRELGPEPPGLGTAPIS